jgi:hypothetical protein
VSSVVFETFAASLSPDIAEFLSTGTALLSRESNSVRQLRTNMSDTSTPAPEAIPSISSNIDGLKASIGALYFSDWCLASDQSMPKAKNKSAYVEIECIIF